MSPKDVAQMKAFKKQAEEIQNKMETRNPSPARRTRARVNGYRGPLTRNELARMVAE